MDASILHLKMTYFQSTFLCYLFINEASKTIIYPLPCFSLVDHITVPRQLSNQLLCSCICMYLIRKNASKFTKDLQR